MDAKLAATVATNVAAKPCIIIDTNVVLNWLFFQDAPTIAVITPLLATHHWVSTEWMLREAQRVAHSRHLAKYALTGAFEALDAGFSAHATLLTSTALSPLKCRDPDDQAFLNLACHTQAVQLLTLDRDLLKLRKRAATLGLRITAPGV